MLTQNLPSSATDYAREQRLEQRAALAAIRRQWGRMSTDFDRSWAIIAPTVLAITETAQVRVAESAARYIPAVLEETGQTAAIPTTEVVNAAAFAGVTGAGTSVAELLTLAPVRAKQAVQGYWVEESYDLETDRVTPRRYVSGKSAPEALSSAGSWLFASIGTILSDTGRAAESTGIGVRPVRGWVRMLTPPSCGRCVILAGKFFWRNQGFERHPGCDCRHIPASEAIAGDLTIDTDSYLDSLDKAGQVKVLGSEANWAAWDEYGADPAQIINAYRWGLKTAQDNAGNTIRYTFEGTTKRGTAGRAMRDLSTRLDRDAGAVVVAGKRQLVRRMPETILRTTASPEQVARQMRLYGWTTRQVVPQAQRTTTVLAQQGAESAGRSAAATGASRITGTPTASAGGSGSGSRPPVGPPTGRGDRFGPEPDPRDKAAHDAYWNARARAIEQDFPGVRFGTAKPKPEEVRFAEQFASAGYRFTWIPERRHLPSNDFRWAGNEIELKATRPTADAIHGRILDAASRAMRNHGFVKDAFIIDTRGLPVPDAEKVKLADFNVGRRKYRIRRLWLWTDSGLEEIALRT